MFIKGGLREHERTPYITPLKYSVSGTNVQQSTNAYSVAVSVDICSGGLGIITDFPLEQGHVLTLIDTVKINNIVSKKTAVVRWTGKVYGKYRAGLKFV